MRSLSKHYSLERVFGIIDHLRFVKLPKEAHVSKSIGWCGFQLLNERLGVEAEDFTLRKVSQIVVESVIMGEVVTVEH